MDEVGKWITSYQNFNKTYIIESEEQYDPKIQEESQYVTVLSPSGFINQKGETICYLNSTIQVQYRNIIFRGLFLILIVKADFIILILTTTTSCLITRRVSYYKSLKYFLDYYI